MSSHMPRDARGLSVPIGAAVVAVVVTLLASTFGFTGSAAATSEPELQVSGTQARLGGALEITGTGFADGTTIDLELCGVPDEQGRFSCTSVAEDVAVPSGGRFTQTVPVREPAGECPCVVKAVMPERAPVITPVDVIGVPVATKVRSPQIVVDDAWLVDTGGPRAWFTGTSTPELLLTLRNAGVAPARPTLYLNVAKPGSGTAGIPVDDPGVPEVQAGEILQVRVPVTHTNLLGGAFAVTGDVVVGDMYAAVSADARVTPWGLYALMVAAVIVVAVGLRRRLRGPVPTPTSRRAEIRRGVTPGAARPTRRKARNDGPTGPPRLDDSLPSAPVPAAAPVIPTPVIPAPVNVQPAPIAVVPPAPVPVAAQVAPVIQVAPQPPRPRRPEPFDPLTAPLEVLAAGLGASGLSTTAGDLHLPAPPTVVTVSAPITPERGVRAAAADYTPPAHATPSVPEPVPAAAPMATTGVIAPGQTGAPSLSEVLRARAAQRDAQRDAQIVTGALEAIKAHIADAPSHLPDQYGHVPGQRDRRAVKGGKRAAR